MKRLPVYLLGLLFLAAHASSMRAQTAAPAPRNLRIALVSDPHVTRGTVEDQPLYRGRLERVIASVNAANVDLVLVAGDLTQNGKAEEFADFLKEAHGFRAPVRWAPGNHDVGNKRLPGKSPGPTAARLENYERTMGPSFWTETCAGVRVIALNSQLFGSESDLEPKMWAMLERETAQPEPGPTVVFMHMPPFVTTSDEPGGDYWNIEPAPRARFLAMLHRGGIRTLLTGHLHYQAVNRDGDLLIVTTAPVSFGLPRGVAPQGWTLITLQSSGEARAEFQRVVD